MVVDVWIQERTEKYLRTRVCRRFTPVGTNSISTNQSLGESFQTLFELSRRSRNYEKGKTKKHLVRRSFDDFIQEPTSRRFCFCYFEFVDESSFRVVRECRGGKPFCQ
mmetsp:Transcript_8496/g.18707  ORF Transcript_8496/g.18707 Transcript_8496/m.18707 type:complete len:108 (-) Transcript_8496:232-555(-)